MGRPHVVIVFLQTLRHAGRLLRFHIEAATEKHRRSLPKSHSRGLQANGGEAGQTPMVCGTLGFRCIVCPHFLIGQPSLDWRIRVVRLCADQSRRPTKSKLRAGPRRPSQPRLNRSPQTQPGQRLERFDTPTFRSSANPVGYASGRATRKSFTSFSACGTIFRTHRLASLR